MSFPYRPEAMPAPLALLSGRTTKLRPLFHAAVIGPARALPILALLDPGADYTVFPLHVAAQIGVDLSQASLVPCRGVGPGVVDTLFLPLPLRLSDGIESREWTGIVGFAPLTSRYALLGQLGVLEFFSADFQYGRGLVDLTVNTLYRGT